MKIVKKIDDVGRIAIPRDLRRSLRWMGGDEIAIIPREDGTILLQKNETDVLSALYELRGAWAGDAEIADAFDNLIVLIDNKKHKLIYQCLFFDKETVEILAKHFRDIYPEKEYAVQRYLLIDLVFFTFGIPIK